VTGAEKLMKRMVSEQRNWGWYLLMGLGMLVAVMGGLPVSVQAQPTPPPSSPAEALRIYEGAANAQNQKAYDLAVEEWGEFLKRFPRDPLAAKARYYEGVCHLQLQNLEKAIASFSAVVQEHPRFELLEDTLLNLGWCQFSLAEQGQVKRYQPAIDSFSQLLEKFPQGTRRDEALFFRAESYYALDKRQEAVTSYRELAQDHADSRLRCDALYAMGVALEELDDYRGAGRAYDQFLSGCSTHELISEVRMRKAETLLQTDYVEAADELFGEVAAIADFSAADYALTRQAICRARQEKFAESGALYADVVKRFPESALLAEAELSAGRAYYRAEDYQAARRWFTAVLKRDGEHAVEAVHWLGRILLREGKAEEVEALVTPYRTKAEGHPMEADLLVNLADAYYEQPARREEAFSLYLEVAERHAEHRQAAQALYNAAFAALELRRLDQCVELSARFLAEHPEDPLAADALLLAVEANLDKRDFRAARIHLESLLATYPEHPDRNRWQLRLGMVHYVAGQYQETQQQLERVLPKLEQSEEIAEAQYLLGASHFFRDQFSGAQSALEASLEASSTWRQADEARLLLARTHQKENRGTEALEQLALFHRDYPESTLRDQAFYREGEIQYGRESFAEAVEAYRQVVRVNNRSAFAPFALHGLGWSEIKRSQFAEASRYFALLRERYPDHELTRSARLAAGMALRQEGKPREAIAELEKFLATNPEPPQKSDALYERGLAEGAADDYERAAATFRQLLQQDSSYVHADKVRYELAWAERNHGNAEAALEAFKQLAQGHPESPLAAEAHFHVAEDLYQRRQYGDAIESFQVAQRDASLTELKEKTTYKLGWTFFQLKRYSEAAEQFAEQAASFPDGVLSADALFMRAESLYQQDLHEEALAAFQIARQASPSSRQMAELTLLHAGQSASQLKQYPRAIEFFDELESQFPESSYLAETWYERGWARHKQEQLDEALADYERAAAIRNALGVRARFMMGEVRFAQKKYDEAIREFQRAMFLYGGDDAPAEIKSWQVKAAYEAGRCAEVQIESAANDSQRASAISNAKKFYEFVVRNPADETLSTAADKRLDVLMRF
jgi:cellulose synthase operon protein C